MTSKIVVNNIEADAGVSTVTFNSNVVRGDSNLHSTGLALGAGSTVGAVTGVTTYYGDGSQLTGISAGVSLANGADNRVVTATGAAALNAESNLTFDGSGQLSIAHTDPKIALVDTTNNTDAYIFSDDNGSIRFQADQNSEASDTRIRFQTDGSEKVSIDSELKIFNGNLFFGTSGKGINFHTSNTGTANLLDAYEEGTWTPQVLNGWGILNPTYSEQAGVYIKIGRLVHVTLRIKLSGGSTNGNRIAVSGFPFSAVTIGTSGYANGGYAALNGYCDTASSNAQSVFCMVGRSGTTAELFHRESNGESSFTGTELGAAGSSFNFSGTYMTP